MGDDEIPQPPPMMEVELVEAIGNLARSYAILRRTDQDSKYEFNDIVEAIKRMAKRICKE